MHLFGELLLQGFQLLNSLPALLLLSLEDFRAYSRAVPFSIIRSLAVNPSGDGSMREVRFWPNLLASYGIFMIRDR